MPHASSAPLPCSAGTWAIFLPCLLVPDGIHPSLSGHGMACHRFARHYQWAGRANPSAIGYLDLLPSVRHRCPDSVPFCYHSPAAFFGIVHTPSENVTVHLTAQVPPRNLRFNLLNAPNSERIVMRFGWNVSYSPSVRAAGMLHSLHSPHRPHSRRATNVYVVLRSRPPVLDPRHVWCARHQLEQPAVRWLARR